MSGDLDHICDLDSCKDTVSQKFCRSRRALQQPIVYDFLNQINYQRHKTITSLPHHLYKRQNKQCQALADTHSTLRIRDQFFAS